MSSAAAAAAAWSAGQHLSALGSLTSKLERLECQAEMLDSLQQEEGGFLKAYRATPPSPTFSSGLLHTTSASAGAGSATSTNIACGLLSAQVTELKSFIQAVADAELDGDDDLLPVTASHAARFAAGLIRDATAAPGCVASRAHQVVVDLAASTLSMLSQRAPAHEVLATAGAVPVLLSLLDPEQSDCAVENAAKALGNLSADAACRSLIRSSGGIGSLARLLRSDCQPAMQASAAAALSLLAARDAVVSDTLRYLGVVPLLVDLLNAPHLSVTEAARSCLLSLKHNNPRNASDILINLRSNSELCKDYWRLKDALLLLGESPPAAASTSPLATSLANITDVGRRPVSPAPRRPASPSKQAALQQLGAAVEDARREVAAAALTVVGSLEDEVVRKAVARAERPLASLQSNLDASIALLKASLADTRAAAAASRAAAAASTVSRGSGISRPRSAPACTAGVPKAAAGKHPMRYSCEELAQLLQRTALDAADVAPVRRSGLTGAELLLLSESQLVALLGVAPHKARRIARLQAAVALYDAIATRVAQPRLTEVELRLWLAAQGCGSAEAARVVKLLRSLVLADPDAPAFTAWEWVAGWSWVQHAFSVYGVPLQP